MEPKSGLENFPFQPRPKLQPGAQMHIRKPLQVEVSDIEQQPMKYVALALTHLHNVISALPNMVADHSKPVDEYNGQSLAPESDAVGANLFLQAQYETPEIIENIVVTGPPNGTVNLQLGDRNWNLVMSVTGVIHIGPLTLCLSRSDNRVLTVTGTPGQYTLELMGHADSRGNLI